MTTPRRTAKPTAPTMSSLGPVCGSGTPVDGNGDAEDDLLGDGLGCVPGATAGGVESDAAGLGDGLVATGLAAGAFSPRF